MKKKILSVLLVACILMAGGILPFASASATGTAATKNITVSNAGGKIGSVTEISVSIDADTQMAVGSFVLNFDRQRLMPIQYTVGSVIQNSSPMVNLSYGDPVTQTNQVKVSWMGTTPLNAGGELIKIQFQVIGTVVDGAAFPLTLSDLILADTNGDAVSCNVVAGGITFYNVLMGDVDENGTVNILDAYLILRYDAGLATLTDPQKVAADVCPDGVIDIFDAMRIQRYDLGLGDLVDSTTNYAVLYRMVDPELSDYKAAIFTDDGKLKSVLVSPKIKINGVNKPSLDTSYYTPENVEKIFNGMIDLPSSANSSSTVSLSAVMSSYGGYEATDALTPKIFLQTLFGATLDNKTAPVFNNAIVAASVGTIGTPRDMKVVTCDMNSDGYLTALNIPLNQPNNGDVFNFAGYYENTEYSASLVKFSNGRPITDQTKVFYISEDKTSADWQVRNVTSLKDGAMYDAYFYDYTSVKGTGAIMLYPQLSVPYREFPTYVLFKSIKSRDNGDDVYKIYYWKDGVAVTAPILAETTVNIEGVKADVADLKTGDVFAYDLDSDGRVANLHVLFSPGTQQAKLPGEVGYTDNQFINMMNINGIEDGWMLASDETNDSADSAIWFGYVYKKTSKINGIGITLVGPDGIVSHGQEFLVPTTAKVIKYDAYESNFSESLKEATIGDITQSFFQTMIVDGKEQINFATVDKNDLEYVFLRLYQDQVIEVVIVDYAE